ncbi:MAG TPA: flagellar basal body P-ring formation chaperone FlgA [Chitinispirillaceae bacterium]|jgi:flagella basal body P-ring formation protein FlgA|nr:flagellar basal body P-ring formation chaperone FlgA [Chitinispirillaceae bacterium]
MNFQMGRKPSFLPGKILLVASLSLAAAQSGAAASVVSLSFSDSVLVNDTLIRLGDIADIKSPDSKLNDRIRKYPVGGAAPAGYSRLVNTEDLVNYRLRSEFHGVDFRVSGNRRIVVHTDFVENRIGEFSEAIKTYLDSALMWPEGCWSFELENPEASWKTLRKPEKVFLSGLDNGYSKGSTQLQLTSEQGGQRSKIKITCKIRVTIPVLVSSVEISRGQEFSAENCEMKSIDITRFAPVPFSSFDQLKEKRAARTIAPGTIIHNRLVQSIPVVEKGDQVQIMYDKGRVRLSVMGVAREPGGIGERIWVENAATNKLIRVVIRGKGKVSIPQGGDLI